MRILHRPANPITPIGIFYNFHTIENAGILAPENYRIATLADFQDLITFYGGELLAGADLKALETWKAPNTGATNNSGFSALPAGTRSALGTFAGLLYNTTIWIDNR